MDGDDYALTASFDADVQTFVTDTGAVDASTATALLCWGRLSESPATAAVCWEWERTEVTA